MLAEIRFAVTQIKTDPVIDAVFLSAMDIVIVVGVVIIIYKHFESKRKTEMLSLKPTTDI